MSNDVATAYAIGGLMVVGVILWFGIAVWLWWVEERGK